jgi:predicted nucleic acid-binding protein
MEQSPRVDVRMASAALEREACTLLREFPDLPLSFVDGVSLCLMRREQIPHAFAFDPHVARAGFRCIPPDLSL